MLALSKMAQGAEKQTANRGACQAENQAMGRHGMQPGRGERLRDHHQPTAGERRVLAHQESDRHANRSADKSAKQSGPNNFFRCVSRPNRRPERFTLRGIDRRSPDNNRRRFRVRHLKLPAALNARKNTARHFRRVGHSKAAVRAINHARKSAPARTEKQAKENCPC